MIRLAIVVEGETEEEFVKRVLAEHLRPVGVEPTPIKPDSRGGDIRVDRLAPHMAKLTKNFDCVTSLVDYYGFRGKEQGETVQDLEGRIDREIFKIVRLNQDPAGVFSYVQLHEFEGLLFSKVDAFSAVLGIDSDSVETLRQIRVQYATPEDIDDSPQTAPSKRIVQTVPHYQKRLHGPLIAQDVGLETIRLECPRFDSWLKRLEELAKG